MGGVQADAVRTDRGVVMAEYSQTGSSRLNFMYVTLDIDSVLGGEQRQVWHGSLSQSSPGVLATDGYRAMPQYAVSPATLQSPDGIARSRAAAGPLWHVWVPAPNTIGQSRKFSN